ncbi:hypothetical protein MVLG_00684 [Microbotryum lychnidis-dioicae p1A1 Lamole]|uniref:Uncharacterized protein n=1 Tax=Microbotryum lychnidis-dioicae (strain p1A1 Lamole / MvSl-1064) TaxID=683840 RepID=U5GZT8_USTV1|nr:hypothetical protein MVLG_00684 [Microbotryum lychnidis-dioicae p1A1 Lamole]|eukprot:KDE08960.1 hypothetical protein MVLG_00684 [Microbotryum lychnidis-dioicae p1A1 Lamole]
MDGVTATKLEKKNKSLYISTSFHPTLAPFSPCWQSSSKTTPLRSPPTSTASPHCASTSSSPSLRPGVLDRYVFRASERGNTSTTRGTPCGCEWFGRTLQALGTALGWVVTHTLYAWRRFPANAINVPEVTLAERRLLMAHSAESTAYERYYQSHRTKADTRALVGDRPENRALLTAVNVAEVIADLPMACSPAGCARAR